MFYLAVSFNESETRVDEPFKHGLEDVSVVLGQDRRQAGDPGSQDGTPPQGRRLQVDHTTSAHSGWLQVTDTSWAEP